MSPLVGEKIETIIEELFKQDTLTLDILFSVLAKATQFLAKRNWFGTSQRMLPEKLDSDFCLNLSGIVQYCSVVEYEIFLEVLSW